MRPIISVVLIALLNALPVTQVLAQAQQQQPRTPQVQQSGPWLPPSLQARAGKPVLLNAPADSGKVLVMGAGMSYPRTSGLALDAKEGSGIPRTVVIVIGAALIVALVVIVVKTADFEWYQGLSGWNSPASF